ncbi:hypothetical protein OG943_22495 [Amycolatopsis sp. NBC_00345]|uniref:hypothetical protein n=1 Tax=Amycolatopsis sp. NBC_00345 TaxID=2975955 RepID=UPI002E2602C6
MNHNTPECHIDATDQPIASPLDSFAHLVASLRRIKLKQARLSKERKEHEKVIKAALAAMGATVGTVAGVPVVSFDSTMRIALDQSAVKERYPDVARECSDISEVWTFRLLDAA